MPKEWYRDAGDLERAVSPGTAALQDFPERRAYLQKDSVFGKPGFFFCFYLIAGAIYTVGCMEDILEISRITYTSAGF